MKSFTYTIFCLILLLGTARPSYATEYWTFINNMLPIKYVEDGKASGLAADILTEIMAKSGDSMPPEKTRALPWPEVYTKTLQTENSVILGMARTPEREAALKWVGPFYVTDQVIIAKRGSFDFANKANLPIIKVSTLRGTIMKDSLIKAGVPKENIVESTILEDAVDLVHSDEVDAVAYGTTPIFHVMQQKGIDTKEYEVAYTLRSRDLYFGFNKAIEDSVVEQYQTTLERMKEPDADGQSGYDRIVFKYFRPAI